MTPLRRALVAALLLALISCRQSLPANPPGDSKTELFLLTPLPLAWGEGFALEQRGSPAFAALEQEFTVRLIDLPSGAPAGSLLLAAQPRAFPAEELVALDAWVRAGGRLVLLADPLLEWPSERALGDRLRPPAAFGDTGLLKHWGLRLDAPDRRGPDPRTIGGRRVMTASPGVLVREAGRCKVGDGGLTAHCRLGRGQALIVADADLLNIGDDPADDGNLPALVAAIERMAR